MDLKRGSHPPGETREEPSEDTLRRLLPSLAEHVGPDVVLLLFQTCTPWRDELVARGFCHRTLQLCWTLASVNKAPPEEGEDPDEEEPEAPEVRILFARLGRSFSLQRLDASTGAWMLEANTFLQRCWEARASLHEWLQRASQEPSTGCFSRGAASTAQVLGLKLVQWVGKPEWRYPGISTFAGHSGVVTSVACSADGKLVASGASDMLVKIWDVATGAVVSSFVRVL